MDAGQVKAGDDARDVFVRSLQQVVRVTAPVAYGIAAHYQDMPRLIDAFERKGDLALENIPVCGPLRRGELIDLCALRGQQG